MLKIFFILSFILSVIYAVNSQFFLFLSWFLLFCAAYFGFLGNGTLIILIIFLSIVSLVLLYQAIRIKLFSSFAQKWYQKSLQSLITAKELINTTQDDIIVQILQAKIDYKKVMKKFKISVASSDDLNTIKSKIDQLQNQIDHNHPGSLLTHLQKEGFFSLTIENKYGGQKLSAAAYSELLSTLAKMNLPITSLLIQQPIELISHFGTEEQKHNYLPKIASGEDFIAIDLSLKNHFLEGIIVDKIVNGEKCQAIKIQPNQNCFSFQPHATIAVLPVRLYDPYLLLEGNEDLGVSLVLVPMNLLKKNQQRPCEYSYPANDDEHIMFEMMIGGTKYLGQGNDMLRYFSLAWCLLPYPSMMVGFLDFQISSLVFTRNEKNQLTHSDLLLGKIGLYSGYRFMVESLLSLSISSLDNRFDNFFLGRALHQSIHKTKNSLLDLINHFGVRNEAVYQILEQELSAHSHYQHAYSTENFLSAIVNSHPFLEDEIDYSGNIKDLEKFDKKLLNHFHYFSKKYLISLLTGLTAGTSSLNSLNYPLAHFMQRIDLLSSALYLICEIGVFYYKNNLTKREFILKKFENLTSLLLSCIAIIYFHYHQPNLKEHASCAEWSLASLTFKAQEEYFELCQNIPDRFLGKFLEKTIFPYGRIYDRPLDSLTKKIAIDFLKQKGRVLLDDLSKFNQLESEIKI